MTDLTLPPSAAWQHRGARVGFEVVFLRATADGFAFAGSTAAVEAGVAWAVGYELELDAAWITRRARVSGRSAAGVREVVVEADGRGAWTVDGQGRPELDGCLDVDLEASAFTNAFPVHRLALAVDEAAQAPAAYVDAVDLAVTRLEQDYRRVDDHGGHRRYDYASPAFNFTCQLVYDAAGLVREYPGIAVRAA